MKTAIVTGAGGNLGQAVVKKFIAEGYKVIGTVIPGDTTPVNFPADCFEKAVVDLTNEEDAGKFVESVLAKYGSVDAAVLTVGGFAMGKLADTSAAGIMKQYKLNFETTYNVARPVFVQMVKQDSGHIFMVGSRPGMNTKNGNGMIAYSLAKSLIFRLAELMNGEAKEKNVLTTVVVPGTIDTPQNRKAMPEADFSKWATPEHIAAIIYYQSSQGTEGLGETLIEL